MASDVFLSTSPSFFTSLVLSTVLIWSKSTKPSFFSNLILGLKMKSKPLDVMGATMTVFKTFISLGDMTIQGRVFCISEPTVGLSFTR